MQGIERPITFKCGDSGLLGILHMPQYHKKNIGVLVVVGGPQYRVGSHRQFVLMARSLSSVGYVVMRFDYSGMGDSDGDLRTFENIDDDIDAALIAFRKECPEIDKVVLWGLCDGASAIMMRAAKKTLIIEGAILVNPWARTYSGEAHAYLKHYYSGRLLSSSFWRKLISGKFRLFVSILDLFSKVKIVTNGSAVSVPAVEYIEKMRVGLGALKIPVLLLISGRDLTAKEFMALNRSDPRWGCLLKSGNTTVIDMANADHTFSDRESLDDASDLCIGWLENIAKT